jgi:hypothetical protein
VVLTSASEHVPLLSSSRSSSNLLRELVARCGDRRVPVTHRPDGDFRSDEFDAQKDNWDTQVLAFRDFIARLQDPRPAPEQVLYMQSASIPQALPELADLAAFGLVDSAQLEQGSPRLWIGTGGHRVAAHFDTMHNLACPLIGRKRFTLFPPEALPHMYIGPLDDAIGAPSSRVSVEAPDLARFPRFRAAQELSRVAELEPGDVLFLPAYWWHAVESIGLNVMLNYWWDDVDARARAAANACFMHGLLALRELPAHRRRIVGHLFDYFVFQAHGDPYAHLALTQQGIAGAPTDERRATLNAIVRRDMLRSTAVSRTNAPLVLDNLYEIAPGVAFRPLGSESFTVAGPVHQDAVTLSFGQFEVVRCFSPPTTPRQALARIGETFDVKDTEFCDTVAALLERDILRPV